MMGNPIQNSMRNLEMRQLNLNEWIRKESLADSVLLTKFSLGFSTETIQKKPEQLQAGHQDSGHLHRMRTFNKTKWKPCDLFLPS